MSVTDGYFTLSLIEEAKFFGGRFGNVYDISFAVRAPVIDLYIHRFAIGGIGDGDDGAHWKAHVCGGKFFASVLGAAGSSSSFKLSMIIGSKACF